MDRHPFAKGGDGLRKPVSVLAAQALDPLVQDRTGRVKERFDLVLLKLSRERDRREPRTMQDFVGIGVADAAEQARVGQGALDRVGLPGQCLPKSWQIRF